MLGHLLLSFDKVRWAWLRGPQDAISRQGGLWWQVLWREGQVRASSPWDHVGWLEEYQGASGPLWVVLEGS